jgi:hypothetical protein
MKNPWPGKAMTIRKNESVSGEVLEFDTKKGEQIVLTPTGKPVNAHRAIPN